MRTKSRTEESLLEMLMYSGVSSLPEPNDKEQVWARAIVKILRKNGHMDYALAYHDFFAWNEVNVTKTLPGLGIAHGLVEIYPYEYLKDEFIPAVENKKDIIDFISSRTSDDEEYLNGMTNDDLKKYFFNVCIKEQISRNEFKNNMKNYKRQPITFEEDLKEETNKEEENGHEEIGNDGESERRSSQENRQTNNRGRKSKTEK